MRYAMTITALASGVALLAATQLPVKASPTFDLKSSTSMLQLVKSGGGGGMGGGGGGGGEAGLTLAAVEWVATTAALAAAEWATWVIWAAVATATWVAWPEATSMAAQIGTVETLPTTETLPAITGMGIGRHHHFRNRFFIGAPFFYGGYYAYNGYGNCAWLRRQAIITGSPYWWERYQACLYY